MKNPLAVVIPGLGSGGVNPEDPNTWPEWVARLYVKLVELVPGVIVMVGNYTDAQLTEKIIAAKAEAGCDGVILAGHSDGGAACDWIQSHVKRLGESLVIDLLVFLDNVTDWIRHGPLCPLDPSAVLRCIRIYQTADPIIHSNPVKFSDGRDVENMPTSGPPFNHPNDNHEDVAEDSAVQDYIVGQVAAMVEPHAMKLSFHPVNNIFRRLLVPLVSELISERLGRIMTQFDQLSADVAANKAETAKLFTSASTAIAAQTAAIAALTAKIQPTQDITQELADLEASTAVATQAQQALDAAAAALTPSTTGQ